MNKSNRLIKFFKDKLTQIFQRSPKKDEPSLMSNWDYKDDSILIPKRELEEMETELLLKTDTIKKLKTSNACNQSLIEDYENTFERLSFVDFSPGPKIIIKSSKVLLEDELQKLRSREDRLKSHIKALKRDLYVMKQECDAKIEAKDTIINNQNKEIEDKDFIIKKQSSIIQELSIANTNLKYQIDSKCCEPLELVEVCKQLSKDFV